MELGQWIVLSGMCFVVTIVFILVKQVTTDLLSANNLFIPCELSEVEGWDEELFEELGDELEEAGYTLCGDYKMIEGKVAPKEKSKSETTKEIYMRVYKEISMATTAQIYYSVLTVSIPNGKERLVSQRKSTSLGIDTTFKDGIEVCATTKLEPQMFPQKGSVYLRCTDLNEVSSLIAQHRKKVAEVAEQHPLDVQCMELSIAEHFNKGLRETYEKATAAKRMKYNSQYDCYRWTAAVGLHMIYKMIVFELVEKKKYEKQGSQFVSIKTVK